MFNNNIHDDDLALRLDPIDHLAVIIDRIRTETLLRRTQQPEWDGFGMSYFDDPLTRLKASAEQMCNPSRSGDADDARERASLDDKCPCKPHPLHGSKGKLPADNQVVEARDRHSNRRKPADSLDRKAAPSCVDQQADGVAVQPLVKEERDNGRTAMSIDLASGAEHRASSENSASAIRLVGFAHRDNHGSTASRSAQLVLQKGVLQLIEGKPSGDSRVIALHGAEDLRPTSLAAVPSATTPTSSDCPFDYLRFDYFDNGPPHTSSRKKRARHVINVFAATHGSRSRGADYRISFLSEGRFFKRSVPDGVNGGMAHEFYHRIWMKYEELRAHEALEPTGAQFHIGHWKDGNNHVVPFAAAILVTLPEQRPVLIARYDDWRQTIEIDKPAKGSRKCRSLVGLGYARISGRKRI